MEATKKLNGKAVGKWLSNNAIIMMMLAITLIVGIMHPQLLLRHQHDQPVQERVHPLHHRSGHFRLFDHHR